MSFLTSIPKQLFQYKLFSWGLLLLLFVMLGCATQSPAPVERPKLWEDSQLVYKHVMECRHNPQEKLLREDWLPWYYGALESVYLYSVPYVAYAVYNGGLVYCREAVLLPTWLGSGGASIQEDADQKVVENAMQYEKLFEECWPEHNGHAHYVNMDAWAFPSGTKTKASK